MFFFRFSIVFYFLGALLQWRGPLLLSAIGTDFSSVQLLFSRVYITLLHYFRLRGDGY